MYLYDHHTSWLIILVQVIALALAIREYRKWKGKKSKEDKHDQLRAIHELVIMLRSSLLGLHRTTRIKFKALETSNVEFNDETESAYDDLKKKYNQQVAQYLNQLSGKAEIYDDYYGLNSLGLPLEKLKSEAVMYEKYLLNVLVNFAQQDYPEKSLEAGRILDSDKEDIGVERFEDRISSIVDKFRQEMKNEIPFAENS